MRLVRRPSTVALAWVAAVAALAVVAVPGPFTGRHPETEQELQGRIEREANPIRKAKLGIRLATLKLSQAEAAYAADKTDDGAKLLDAYWSWVSQAWSLLQSSGRDASRQPHGFKELDIALRESARRLADLRQRLPYADRGPIDRVAKQVDGLHTRVLAALFPGGQLGTPAKHGAANVTNPPVSGLRPQEPQ